MLSQLVSVKMHRYDFKMYRMISFCSSAIRNCDVLNNLKYTTSIMKLPDNNIEELDDSSVRFFYKSATTVGVLSLFTLNIYSIYWFYKQWRAIRLSTNNKRIYPALSGIFQFFTSYYLFKRVSDASTSVGYKHFISGSNVASLYMVILLISNALGRYEPGNQTGDAIILLALTALSLIASAILFKVQKAINFYELNLEPDLAIRKYYPGEIIFSTIGILLFVGVNGVLIHTIVDNVYPRGSEQEIASKLATVEILTKKYEDCSDSVLKKESTLDNANQKIVDEYNAKYESCEVVRKDQNKATDEYNYLLGY